MSFAWFRQTACRESFPTRAQSRLADKTKRRKRK